MSSIRKTSFVADANIFRSGYNVITTCSPKNFSLVTSLGVTKAFDYNEKDVGKKINQFTENKLKYVWDCIGEESSAEICQTALSTEPGSRYGCIQSPKISRKDIKFTSTLLYEAICENFDKYGSHFTKNQSHFQFAKKFITEAEALLAAGKIKTHPVCLREGGLEGVILGLEEMKEGRHSAQKLVYNII